MDEAELKAKVKAALQRRLPEYGRVKEFYLEIAELADSSVQAVATWTKGDNAPQAHSLLNLFEKLDGFEAEVRGGRPDGGPTLARGASLELAERLRATAAALEHAIKSPSLAAVPVEGKVSSRGMKGGEKPAGDDAA